MQSDIDSEVAPDHWRLDRQTDEHYVFAYEFSTSVLCHVQRTSDWLVRVDRADGTILFTQHDLRSRAAAFDLAESVMALCTMLHREVVTERSQARTPIYVGNPAATPVSPASPTRGGHRGPTRRPLDTRQRPLGRPPVLPSEVMTSSAAREYHHLIETT